MKKIRYAKEFFVTEKGETIKMAALITTNPKVRLLLEQQRKRRESQAKKKSESGALREHYLSIIKIKVNDK